jgi:5'-nucleotidase
MQKKRPLVLLTNDDGIQSPGLWAAAEGLQACGDVCIVAPREQCTSTGRSNPSTSDGIISDSSRIINGTKIQGYAVGASPAQAVHFAMLEILPQKPDLVVSGINYGCNTGVDITRSGTIGAALEGASYGIPSLAVSVETSAEMTFSYSTGVDFSTSAFFTRMFAQRLLANGMQEDVSVLKIEIPANATTATPWEITTLSQASLYLPDIQKRPNGSVPTKFSWKLQHDLSVFPIGSDAHTVFVKRLVAVTPLSLDLTSRINLDQFEKKLRSE